MLKSNKESGDYLRQIRNNIPEKVNVIEQYLDNHSLPKTKDGKIKIIELGTGGGQSLQHIKRHIVDSVDVELLAVDIIPSLAASLKKEIDIEAVAADAGVLPFANESISAINASAVFHEVSSYGTSNNVENVNTLYGKEALIKTLGELNRVLLPSGIVAYRDVLAPSGDLTKEKTVKYFNESWKYFTKWFAKDFSESNPHFYENIKTSIDDTEEGFSLATSVGFQRELQRHYLMLRDYLRNVKQQEFGLTMLSSVWLNETEGLKFITFSLDNHLTQVVDLTGFEIHDSAAGKVYRGDSDQFDKIYDDLMRYYFTQLDSASEKGNNFRNLIEEWKDREGTEHYIYGNVADILKFSCKATQNITSKYVLFPELASDINIAPRFYYNRYLKQVIDDPEKDGKQIISFKKLSKNQALKSLQGLQSSPVSREILDSETIKQLQEEIERIF